MVNTVGSAYGLRPAAYFQTANSNVSSAILNPSTNSNNVVLVKGYAYLSNNGANLLFNVAQFFNNAGGQYMGVSQLSTGNWYSSTNGAYASGSASNTTFRITLGGLRNVAGGGCHFEIWMVNQGWHTSFRTKAYMLHSNGYVYHENGGGSFSRSQTNTDFTANFNGTGSVKIYPSSGSIQTAQIGLWMIGAT